MVRWLLNFVILVVVYVVGLYVHVTLVGASLQLNVGWDLMIAIFLGLLALVAPIPTNNPGPDPSEE